MHIHVPYLQYVNKKANISSPMIALGWKLTPASSEASCSHLLLVAVRVQPVIIPLPVIHVRDLQLLLLFTLGKDYYLSQHIATGQQSISVVDPKLFLSALASVLP
jgi:hypothetical protein